MTLGEHFAELRKRLLRCVIGIAAGMILTFIFGREVFTVLFYPLSVATNGHPPPLRYLSLLEPFTTYFRVCLIVGTVAAGPYVLYQLWAFIAAGLYEHERKAISRYLVPSVLLFFTGVVFFFLIISPIVISFLLQFGSSSYPTPPAPPEWAIKLLPSGVAMAASRPAGSSYVEPGLTLNEYISFTAQMSLVFGLAFQMPLVVIILARLGIVPVSVFKRFRKYVFMIIIVVSAVITPTPDALTMLAMALPMYLLYEIGLLIAPRKDRPRTVQGERVQS